MKKQIWLALIIASVLFASDASWAQRKKLKKKQRKEAMEKNVAMLKAMSGKEQDDEAETLDSFVEGMKYYILEEYDKALARFQFSLKRAPSNAAIHYQIAKSHLALKQYEKAEAAARKSLELNKDNQYYYTLLADLYREQRLYAKAVPVLEKMIAQDMGKKDNYLDLASYYLMTNSPDKALETYNAIEAKFGFDERIIRQKQRIHIRKNNLGKAIEEGQKLVDAFPNVPEYVIEQAQLLMGAQKVDQSIELLEEVLNDNPEQMQAKFLLSDAYEKKGNEKKAEQLLEEAIASPLMDFPAKADVITQYLRKANDPQAYSKGLKLSKLVVEAHPKQAKAHALYADMLIVGQEKAMARDAYLESVKLDGNNFNAWKQISAIDWELQQSDSMAKHTEMALEFFPNQALLYLQNGVAQMMQENHQEAADALEHGKMISSANPLMVKQFNSYLGDVYHKMGEYDKSDEAFEAVLGQDPNDLHALNNYSYFLSLRGENIELAKTMGEKLVKLQPNNDTYLDTYGWILYTAGEYEEARIYLEKAAENSSSGTVVEHYGDVLYQLGDKEAAISQWKRAKELGNSENPDKLERKLDEGRLLE